MRSPLVSVIVPNYNHERFLIERIESILNQTYRNLEIIILDDHSTDNSKEIINQYQNHPLISNIVFNESNSGSPFKQWNKGFQLAKGELIWIAESDDSCDTRFLERLISVFNSTEDCTIVYSATQYIDEKGNRLPTPHKHHQNETFYYVDFIKQRLAVGTDIWNASSAIFKQSLVSSIPSLYTDYINTGDHLFWIEAARAGQGFIVYLDEPLNYCRQHTNNTSSRKDLFFNIFYEEYQIFKIQCSYHYIGLLRKYAIIDKYRSLILSKGFTREKERQNALKLWHIRSPYQWIPV